MVVEAYSGVFIGGEEDCRGGTEELAVVHACKNPCHCSFVGYRGKLSQQHPNYLAFRRGYDLALNLIDPPTPLFMPKSFSTFLDFASDNHAEGRSILIHCNRGESRAPSLALLYLAKRVGALPNDSYANARNAFSPLYPSYLPGLGIQAYLSNNWNLFE